MRLQLIATKDSSGKVIFTKKPGTGPIQEDHLNTEGQVTRPVHVALKPRMLVGWFIDQWQG